MTTEIQLLMATAASIAFVHTVMGPDHYLPFVVLAKARHWSAKKLASITLLCGFGHILSSVVLGVIGIALGTAMTTMEWVQAVRGDLAAWCLIAFGFTYLVWGLKRAYRGQQHSHLHSHGDLVHEHTHNHTHEHSHLHEQPGKTLTPWVMFIIFVLGPCELLIPLLMYPAAQESVAGLMWVVVTFSSITMITMLAIVMLSYWGLNAIKLPQLARFSHAMAGGTVLVCGLSIQLLHHH